MKNQIRIQTLLIFTLTALSLHAFAAKPKLAACELCEKIEKAQISLKVPSEETRKKAIELMSTTKLSPEGSIRRQEIKKVLELSAQLIPQDASGETDDYLDTLYREAPKDFDREIKTLPKPARKIIQDSLKQSAEVDASGNG